MAKEPSIDGRSFASWDEIISETIIDSSNEETDERIDSVGKRETRHLELFKTAFLGLLLVATVLISWTVFTITSSGENAQFENHFQDQGTRLLQEFSLRFSNVIGAFHSFDVTITSHVSSMNLKWPYAFVPEFDIRAESILAISNAKFVSYLIKVTSQRNNFEAYVQNNSFWVEHAYARNSEGQRRLQEGNNNSTLDDLSGENGNNSTADPTGDGDIDDSMGSGTNDSLGLPDSSSSMGIFPSFFTFEQDNQKITEVQRPEYDPVFQCHPVAPDLINYNLLSHPLFGTELERSSTTRSIVVGQMVLPHPSHKGNRQLESNGLYRQSDPYIDFIHQQHPDAGPFSQITLPIFDNFSKLPQVVGFVSGYLFWSDLIVDQLPDTVEQAVCVVENNCGQVVSFEVNSNRRAKFLGEGDFHNPAYDDLETRLNLPDVVNGATREGIFATDDIRMDLGYCPYTIKIYPSQIMDDSFDTNRPLFYMFLVMGMFIVTCCTFFGYDFLHERRNKVVMATARQTQRIVSSLFPAIVRDRLFEDVGEVFNRGAAVPSTPRVMLRSYLNEGEENDLTDNKPIADLFPETTIMFADISGFTAWSSLREPAQVFTLLETIYAEFDKLAKKQQVFKVETIGDCYVAVAGLPDPQPDHANIMAKFANFCLSRFAVTVKNLETTLGPDTSDLGLRVGLHSGPVTAGVLRGEKSRFQLFGDTMNTASRMESTSKSGRIQCSAQTAKLLREAGCGDLLVPRSQTVEIKGKGVKQTYWIKLSRSEEGRPDMRKSLSEPFVALPAAEMAIIMQEVLPKYIRHKSKILDTLQSNQRLIDWHVEMLSRLLKQIVAVRKKKPVNRRRSTSMSHRMPFVDTPMSELTEIVEMPQFDKKKAKHLMQVSSTAELPPEVVKELRRYISTLACMYIGKNPFHNFAHASHVTMASNKLLSRVVAPHDNVVEDSKHLPKGFAMKLHDYTYGLTSDPLTQFAIVFSALIHDVDHRGVSNGQLVKEETEEALKYEGKSVAEQHSIDIAWKVLMDPKLENLRQCIYETDEEYVRFRQLVVNCVIATDIFDKDLKDLRNRRWDQAFHGAATEDGEDEIDNFNRRATIVIEHIIQAADVSHTMQHWLVYLKWNERLFAEMFQAYKGGRGSDKDPSEGWYNGELWFFDNYVIPLAKKLEECGVFGVSSAECLDYAMENREQWQKKGEEIVEGFKKRYCGRLTVDTDSPTSVNSA